MNTPFSFREDSMVFHAPVQRRQAGNQGVGSRVRSERGDEYPTRRDSPYLTSDERSYAPLPTLPTLLRTRSHLRSMPDNGLSPILAPSSAPMGLEQSYRGRTLSTDSPPTKNSLGYILGESRTPTHRHHGRDERFRPEVVESNLAPRFEPRPLHSVVARARFASDSSGESSSYNSSPLRLPRPSLRGTDPVSVQQVDRAAAPTTEPTKKKRKARICTSEGCTKYVVDHGLCIRHGGGKRCYIEGCDCRAQNRGLCWKHGGFTICKVDGCTKRAKSRGICWSHGGGTRCKREDCSKIAVSNGLCWAHGGGKRCEFGKCRKPASERTNNYCSEHYASEGNSVEAIDH